MQLQLIEKKRFIRHNEIGSKPPHITYPECVGAFSIKCYLVTVTLKKTLLVTPITLP